VGPSDTDDPVPGPHLFPYASATAFRTALRDRFAAIAKAETRFPLPDHVADKFTAILGTHVRGETVTGSSRVKDLVDIALIATTQQISGPALRTAVLAGAAHRNLSLPDAFAVSDEAVWRRGYPQSAADAPGPAPTFDEAVSLACALLNPVLKGPVSGNWDPATASWTYPAG